MNSKHPAPSLHIVLSNTKCSLDRERGELLPSLLPKVGGTSVLRLLPLSSLALSLPTEKESEKMREEVKEVRGTMRIESLTHLLNK